MDLLSLKAHESFGMRVFTVTSETGRNALISDGMQDYIAFEDGDDAAAWSALLPALGIKTAAGGTSYCKRAGFEALVGGGGTTAGEDTHIVTRTWR